MHRLFAFAFILILIAASPLPADDGPDHLFFAIGGIRGESKEIEIGTIAVSADGQQWRTVFKGGWVKDHFTHGNDNLIRGITFGEGRYVAAGNKGIGMMVSDDGRSWRHATQFGDGFNAFNVCYGNGIFVAARATDLLRSEDGLAWTKHRTLPDEKVWGEEGLGHMREVVFGNGVFVCVGDRRIGATKDGKTYIWHKKLDGQEIPKRRNLLFGAGRFLWLKDNGHMTSTDGVQWKPLTIGDGDPKVTAAQAYGGCFNGEQFIVTGGGKMWKSPDGLKWTESPTNNKWAAPKAGRGDLLIGRDIVSSDGGKTWQRVKFEIPTREIVALPADQDRPAP